LAYGSKAAGAWIKLSAGQFEDVKVGLTVTYGWDEPERAALILVNHPGGNVAIHGRMPALPPTPLPALKSMPTTRSVVAQSARDAAAIAALPTGDTTEWGKLKNAYRTLKRWRYGTVRSVAEGVITIAVPEYEGQAAIVQTINADEKTKILRATPAKPPSNLKILDNAPTVRLEYAKLSAVRAGLHVDFAWDEPDRAAIIQIVPAQEITILDQPPLEPTPFPMPSTKPTTQPGSAIP
jgi:hypothetical protein